MMTIKHIITQFSQGSAATEADLGSCHIHEGREILYVVNGVSRFTFNNQVFDAVPGTVFIIDSWLPHAVGYRKEDHGLFHLWIHCKSQARILISPIKVTYCGEFNLREQCISLPTEYGVIYDRRWNILRQMDGPDHVSYERLLREPINAMLDEFMFQSSWNDMKSNEKMPKVDSVIENVKEYIRTNNAQGCTLERLEKLSGYNRFYLSHRFRQYMGCSIGEYVNEVRLKYTKAALARGMRQKEIAEELGFSSPSNFWNWLQRHKD